MSLWIVLKYFKNSLCTNFFLNHFTSFRLKSISLCKSYCYYAFAEDNSAPNFGLMRPLNRILARLEDLGLDTSETFTLLAIKYFYCDIFWFSDFILAWCSQYIVLLIHPSQCAQRYRITFDSLQTIYSSLLLKLHKYLSSCK